MSRLFDDGSSQYLDCGGSPLSAGPMSLACWVYMDDITSVNATYIGLTDSSVSNIFANLGFNDGTDQASFSVRDGASGVQTANSTGTLSLNTWHHVAGVMESATSRYAFLDGVAGAQSTLSRNPTTLNSMCVGARIFSSVAGGFMPGRIAEVAIWNVGLTAEEVAALAARLCPLMIRPSALVAYLPIGGDGSPEPDLLEGFDGSVQAGPTKAEHIGLVYPGFSSVIVPPSVAGASIIPKIVHNRRMRN